MRDDRTKRSGKHQTATLVGAAWGAVLLLTGCIGTPDGVEAVSSVDLERYLGRWYEIARLDHPFERGLTDVTATYSWRSEGSRVITVVNRGWDTEKGEWKEARGRAKPMGDPTDGQLKVSFFGPFYGGYNIVALDEESYSYALVCGPNRSYLWILARNPELDETVVQRLVAQAAELGFATDELIMVSHDRIS